MLKLQFEISSILAGAGFPLRKWLSNSEELQRRFQTNTHFDLGVLNIRENEQNKTLGVYWNPKFDTLNYRINPLKREQKVTKRQILSVVSQIFDKMGLAGPVVMRAKMMLRLLWRENLNWDQPVSNAIQAKFQGFYDDLQALNTIDQEMHVFSDASEKGYGACVCLRSNAGNDTYNTKLLRAKGKVAPIKQLTLPRLELCAALLGAKLAQKVRSALNIVFTRCIFWSDSTITYYWIQGSLEKWRTFVSNQVSMIQCLTDSSEWRHIRSQDNSADCISRVVSASEIGSRDLWWHGPPWLSREEREWAASSPIQGLPQMPKQRKINSTLYSAIAIVTAENLKLFLRFSSLNKLKRVIAYCLRFKHNTRRSKEKRSGPQHVLYSVREQY